MCVCFFFFGGGGVGGVVVVEVLGFGFGIQDSRV